MVMNGDSRRRLAAEAVVLAPAVRRRLIQEGLSQRAFPPRIQLPEQVFCPRELAALFEMPVVVWVPEVLNPLSKPHCVVDGCSCTPRLRDYKARVVEDIAHKTVLLYTKYQCTADGKTTFSTVHDKYLSQSALLQLHFPYLLTKKSGVSHELLDLVHDAMLGSGLQSLAEQLSRRRHNRFYRLLSIFAATVRERVEASPTPTGPWTMDKYNDVHSLPCSETLTDAWMAHTDLTAKMSRRLRGVLEIRKAVRVDHTANFPKRLLDASGGDRHDARLLLLARNEIGQIVGHAFTQSAANNSETVAALTRVLERNVVVQRGVEMSDQQSPVEARAQPVGDPAPCIYVVSDNANTIRSVVETLSTEERPLVVKQNPFYAIQRITNHVKKTRSSVLTAELAEAMGDTAHELLSPSVMAERVAAVLEAVPRSDIVATDAQWIATASSTLEQIVRGELHVASNWYRESSSRAVAIVSTSQNHPEAFHLSLRRLLGRSVSAAVATRLFDLHILQHNLAVGCAFGRGADLGCADLEWICRSAVLCDSIAPSTTQYEFALSVLSRPREEGDATSDNHSTTNNADGAITWETLYPSLKSPVAARHDRPRGNSHTLRLVAPHARVCQHAFFQSMAVSPSEDNENSRRSFMASEDELLLWVRKAQLSAGADCKWRECDVATTILFNTAVAHADGNPQYTVGRRSCATIASRLESLRQRAPHGERSVNQAAMASDQSVFQFESGPLTDDDLTPAEDAFARELYRAGRDAQWLAPTKRFRALYDLGAHLCVDIGRRSDAKLLKIYDRIKRASNRAIRRRANGPATDSVDHTVELDAQVDSASGGAGDSAGGDSVAGPSIVFDSDTIGTGDDGQAAGAGDDAEPPTAGMDETSVMAALVAFDASLPSSVRGRWRHVHTKYTELVQTPTLDYNKLRCRVRRLKAAETRTASDVTTVECLAPTITQMSVDRPPTSVGRWTKCDMCTKRKRKCGDATKSPHCLRVRVEATGSATAYVPRERADAGRGGSG